MDTCDSQISSFTVSWKQDDSAGAIPAHIHYPTSANTPLPIALLFHVGGFVLGSTDLVPKSQINYLVSRGLVVVAPEYRLCPQVSLYDGPVHDAKDVLQWCQQKLSDILKEKGVAVNVTRVGVAVNVTRVGVMGLSAGGMLALTTGLSSSPPSAIVDFYGCKQLADPAWTQPLPMFANIPDQPQEFIDNIFDGPQALTSLPMFVSGKPLLSDPRCAWYIQQLKNGTSISALVPDGDYARTDPTAQFTAKFPPTYFLHGDADEFVGHELSVRSHEELKKLGVETELVIAPGIGHVFDLELKEEDVLFQRYVAPALEWLIRHV